MGQRSIAFAVVLFLNSTSSFAQHSAHDVAQMRDALLAAISDRFDSQTLWEPSRYPSNQSKQPGGRTAFAVMTLLDAGIPAQRDDLAEAIPKLAAASMTGTYALAARLMAFRRLPLERRAPMYEDVDRLLRAFDHTACGWDYGPVPRSSFVDQSLTQFCVLALTEAIDGGATIDRRLFERVRSRFLALQDRSGGWGYRRNDTPRGSMTAAGLATLTLCNEHAPQDHRAAAVTTEAIARASAWLAESFTATSNPGSRRWTDYWLLSLERAARATGDVRFGTDRWLEAGIKSIASRLLTRGSDGWRLRGGTPAGIEKLCFATQFLSRADVPLVLGYVGRGAPPHIFKDVLGLIGEQLEETVGFVCLDEDAPVDDWLLSPLVVFDGGDPPTDSLEESLRTYVHRGGTVLLLNAPRRGEALGERLFPMCSWRDDARVPKARMLGNAARIFLVDLGFIRFNAKPSRATTWIHNAWNRVTEGIVTPRIAMPLARHTIDASITCTDDGEPLLHELLTSHGLSKPEGTHRILWLRGETETDANDVDVEALRTAINDGTQLFADSIGGGQFAQVLAMRLAEELDLTVNPHHCGIALKRGETVRAVFSPRDAALGLLRSPLLASRLHGLAVGSLAEIFQELSTP